MVMFLDESVKDKFLEFVDSKRKESELQGPKYALNLQIINANHSFLVQHMERWLCAQ